MRTIPGYNGYYADEDGLIYSVRSGQIRVISQRKHKGYMHVFVKCDDGNGKRKKEPVHKLVLLSFEGEKKLEQVCRHLNGNPLDNRPKNLKWGTVKENVQDAIRHGTAACLRVGDNSVAAKLTEVEVWKIKELIGQGKRQVDIAKQFNITQRHVSDIKNNKTWRHLIGGRAGTISTAFTLQTAAPLRANFRGINRVGGEYFLQNRSAQTV